MASQVYEKMQNLITVAGKNDPTTISYIRTKLMLKGIDPDKWGPTSEDSPEILMIIEKFSNALIGRG